MLGCPPCVYNVVDLITIGTEIIQSKGAFYFSLASVVPNGTLSNDT